MNSLPPLVVLLGIILAAGATVAHPHSYVGSNDTRMPIAGCPDPFLGPGYVCFRAGEIVADVDGGATFTIADDNLSPTSGYYGQDTDGDGSIDTGTAAIFCGSPSITSGVNWDEGFDIYVFIDGPVHGSPVFSVCGTMSAGTGGFVDHS